MKVLYPDQQEQIKKIYRAINKGQRRVISQGSTGSGKTVIAAHITKDILSKGLGVLFVCPQITLVEQAYESFQSEGIEAGIIQANHELKNFDLPVQICSVQSISAILKRDYEGWMDYQKKKIIMVDEAHIVHKSHKEMIDNTTHPVISFTATPFNKSLGKMYDSIVPGLPVREMITLGRLCDYDAFTISGIDLSGIKANKNGDLDPKEVSERIDKRIVGECVQNYREYADNTKAILFAPLVADAERFAAQFRDSGIKAVSVSGYMDKKDTKEAIRQFRAGEIDVICSVALLTLGFDVPNVVTMLDYQPTESLSRHAQKLGRVLRVAEGKQKAIIIDAAGNLLRLGAPDAIREYDLHSKENPDRLTKEQAEKLPKSCKCGALIPVGSYICPKCGTELKRASVIDIQAGKLVPFDVAMKKNTMTPEHKRDLYAMLKHYQLDKGKSNGYAASIYKQKTGHWPTDYHVEPQVPDASVLSYIKYTNIRRAKSRYATR